MFGVYSFAGFGFASPSFALSTAIMAGIAIVLTARSNQSVLKDISRGSILTNRTDATILRAVRE